MEPINLKQYGLQELSSQEIESINGGANLPKWLKGLGWGEDKSHEEWSTFQWTIFFFILISLLKWVMNIVF
ncbi:MAG: hypothetical protein Q8K92_09055 [Leadbetterella sp.]|nr:hypothetical protein [Leadbetterella sp.]